MRRAVPVLIESLQGAGYRVRIYSAKRSRSEQLYRFINGHTTIPPGASKHEKGRAVDLIIEPKEGYRVGGEIWTELGGIWGGNFKNPELAKVEFQHFEDASQQLWRSRRSSSRRLRRAPTRRRR